jgi:tripartite-type tricarboxylate transporter receptor subunit TctC
MLVFACALYAQDYPAKPLRLIVPSFPGGGTDTTARIIAPRLTDLLGQQVVVENRAGEAAMLGSEAVARATSENFGAFLRVEAAKWAKVVKAAGLKQQ